MCRVAPVAWWPRRLARRLHGRPHAPGGGIGCYQDSCAFPDGVAAVRRLRRRLGGGAEEVAARAGAGRVGAAGSQTGCGPPGKRARRQGAALSSQMQFRASSVAAEMEAQFRRIRACCRRTNLLQITGACKQRSQPLALPHPRFPGPSRPSRPSAPSGRFRRCIERSSANNAGPGALHSARPAQSGGLPARGTQRQDPEARSKRWAGWERRHGRLGVVGGGGQAATAACTTHLASAACSVFPM